LKKKQNELIAENQVNANYYCYSIAYTNMIDDDDCNRNYYVK